VVNPASSSSGQSPGTNYFDLKNPGGVL